jgi:hypothetical protein
MGMLGVDHGPRDDPAVPSPPVLAAASWLSLARLHRVRVHTFELRLIATALVAAWSISAILVLVAYRPGGPLDVLVGLTLALPIAIAAAGVVWPPLTRGSGAFALMLTLGLGSLLLLMPSIGGVVNQLQALGSQTLLPSLEAAYPWLLALLGTSLFAGFGLARRRLGGTALRPRRLRLGIAIGIVLTFGAGVVFASAATINEIALHEQPGLLTTSRFGPTDLDGTPPECTGKIGAGASARVAARLSGSIGLRQLGSVDQGGRRNGDEYRWLAYTATDRELGWYGGAVVGGLTWTRDPGTDWRLTTPAELVTDTVDLQAIEVALTPGIRVTAEDRGIELIERAPARRCRIAVDGTVFAQAFPQVRWLVGDADIDDWRGQLDFWVFLDGQVGQIAGNLNGEASVVDPEAVQGSIDVLLTATERGRDNVIYAPAR